MIPARFPTQACAVLLFAILVKLAILSPVAAQNPHAKIFGDWRIRCNSATGAPAQCQMFQNVVVKDSGKPILQTAVGYLPDVATPVGAVTLPLGVHLPPGLTLQIDKGQTYELAYEVCSRSGCHVRFSIDAKLLDAFKGGSSAEIAFYNNARKRVSIPVSLKGFTVALGQLR